MKLGLAMLLAASVCAVAIAGPLTDNPVWTYTGTQEDSALGDSVSSAGDVNGDGYPDIVIGEPGYKVGQTYTGRVLVFLGSPVGPSVVPFSTILGPGGSFGASVAAAGDVNGDGYGDIIVGTPYYNNGEYQEGAAFVYYGSSDGVSATPAWHFEGDEEYAQLGWSVSSARDVNRDGFDDVIIGAPPMGGTGAAFVFRGSHDGLPPTPSWSVVGPEVNSKFGTAVADAGDVNNDGYDDVVVGAPEQDGTEPDAGAAYIYLGAQNGLVPGAVLKATNDQDGANFGASVASAGDVNGDGYTDVIVGAPWYDNDDAEDDHAGAAFEFNGAPGAGPSSSPSWHVLDDEEYSGLGTAVDGAGDVNGDGYDDVAIGNDYPRGRVHLGSATGLSSTPEWTAEDVGWFFNSVATAGDINGDGLSDLIVGNGYANFAHQGKAFLYRGVGPTIALEALDPNPTQNSGWPSLLHGADLSNDEAFLAGVAARPVLGLAADGVTRVLLRAVVSGSGTVVFQITDEDDQPQDVGTLSRLGHSDGVTALEVDVVTPSPGVNVAFAVLKAPPDFYRDFRDTATRPLKVTAEYRQLGAPGGPTKLKQLKIIRPPVALLHGIWSSGTESWGLPGQGWPLKDDARFSVAVKDYQLTNAHWFSVNVGKAKAAVNVAVNLLRGRGYAATQADVFGHSMGGLLFRLYAAGRNHDYVRDNNYGAGDIHKLVTVDTPHKGSELADVLQGIVLGLGTTDPNVTAFAIAVADRYHKCLTCGAVYDLSPYSSEITGLPAVSLPVHALAGKGGRVAQMSGNLANIPSDMKWLSRLMHFLGLDVNQIFENDEHDMIVRLQSQKGGLSTPNHVSVFGFQDATYPGLHTTVCKDPRFSVRAEELLDAKVGDGAVFASGFPAGVPHLRVAPPPVARVGAQPTTIGLVITDPQPGAVVTPGSQITVTVEPLAGFVPDRVLIESNFGGELVLAPPFTATLDLPEEAIGSLVISAVGIDAAGDAALAQDVELSIELPATLLEILVPDDPIELFSYDPAEQLAVRGYFDDGIERDIAAHDRGTTYESANPAVAKVNADGIVTALDAGETIITVSNDSQTAVLTVKVWSAPLVLRADATGLVWPPSADATAYDIVRGNLGTLRATGGDFAAATVECLGRTEATSLPYSAAPAIGQGYWFLTRVVYGDARGEGSYQSDGETSPGPRDLGIAASGHDCP